MEEKSASVAIAILRFLDGNSTVSLKVAIFLSIPEEELGQSLLNWELHPAMKISGRKPVARISPAQGVSRTSKRAKVESHSPIEPSATDVKISESFHEVQRANEILAGLPDVRVDKIGEIKPRVDDGSYNVESEVVAKKMVDSALRESARLISSDKD